MNGTPTRSLLVSIIEMAHQLSQLDDETLDDKNINYRLEEIDLNIARVLDDAELLNKENDNEG